MSFTPIETQEDFDRAVRERIARERAKVADYDELRAKAAKYDEVEEAGRSELERARARINELEADIGQRTDPERMPAIRVRVPISQLVQSWAVLRGFSRSLAGLPIPQLVLFRAPSRGARASLAGLPIPQLVQYVLSN